MPAAKEGEKEPKIIEFEVPVLRFLSGSDSLEFLINVAWEFVPGERIYVSNLQGIILEEIRGSENVFDIPPHSAISVTVYQLEADIRPIRQTTKAFRDAYKVVNSEYLEENAVRHSPHVLLSVREEAQLNKFLALLTIKPPPSRPEAIARVARVAGPDSSLVLPTA